MSYTRSNRKVVGCVAVCLAMTGAWIGVAGAQPWVFTNWDEDHFWNNSGNWNQDTPPPTGQVAWINHTPEFALINELAFGDPSEIVIGQGAGDGAVWMTDGGDIQTGHINIAWGTGTTRNGSWTQDGGLTLVTGEVRAGRDTGGGVATIDISGGTFQTGGHFFLGDGNEANFMTISGGTVNVGGALRMSDRGDGGAFPLSSAPSFLELIGGELNISGLMAIGARTTATGERGDGRGEFTISSNASLTIGANVAMRAGGGNSFSVIGSDATINVNRPSATGFEVHEDNDVNFVFDTGGISTVAITALMRWSHPSSTLNVDASGFTGLGTFDLFTFSGYFDVDGVPKQFGTENLLFAPGRNGFVSYNPTSITLTIEEFEGLPGDFNMDGVVDAADYVWWRKFDGTPAKYNEWRANFGAGTPPGSGAVAAVAAVPEPTSLALLLAACGVALATRRVRRV